VVRALTNLSKQQDETWAEFSTLEVAISMLQIDGVIESNCLTYKLEKLTRRNILVIDNRVPGFESTQMEKMSGKSFCSSQAKTALDVLQSLFMGFSCF
jgi:hypothetical protein